MYLITIISNNNQKLITMADNNGKLKNQNNFEIDNYMIYHLVKTQPSLRL